MQVTLKFDADLSRPEMLNHHTGKKVWAPGRNANIDSFEIMHKLIIARTELYFRVFSK